MFIKRGKIFFNCFLFFSSICFFISCDNKSYEVGVKDSFESYLQAKKINNGNNEDGLSQQEAKEILNLTDKALVNLINVAEIYRLRGIAYIFLRDYNKSIIEFNKSISIDPLNYVTLMGKANVLEKLEKNMEAEKTYLEALAINDNDPAIYYNFGILLGKLKKLNKAIIAYENAIELDPEFYTAYNNRGELYIRLRNYEKAIQDFNVVISSNPLNKMAFNNRGFCKIFIGEYKSAIEDFETSLKITASEAYKENYNTDCYCYNNLGITYYKLGKTDEACSYWKKAIDNGYPYKPEWKELYSIEDPAELIRINCK